MVSGALIVSDKWGPLTDGDVASAVRLLSYQMRILGLEAHCTAIKVSSVEYEEANQLGVTLHLPNPVGRLRLREPHPDWLLMHKLYFPDLSAQQNIKVIFGFGLTTCDAAAKIRKDLFPQARLYLVNLWPYDILRPSYIRCTGDEFMSRIERTIIDCVEANAILSIGFNTYLYHSGQYQTSSEIVSKHFQVPPLPDDRYFSLPRADFDLDDVEPYRVLSYYEDHFIREFHIVSRFADVLRSLKETLKRAVTWKIIGVPSGLEKKLKELLTPDLHSVLETAPPLPVEAVDEEMRNSRLIYVPKDAINSRSLALNSMAYGVPCLVPAESDVHVILNQHVRNIEKYMVDEMRDLLSVKNKIRRFIQKPFNPRYRASEVRRFLHSSSTQSKQDLKRGFMRLIRPDQLEGIRLTRTEAASISVRVKDPFSNKYFRYKLKAIRKPYEATVHLSIKSGIPLPERGMDDVDDDLFGKDRPEFNKCMEKMAGLHPKLDGKHFHRPTTRFIMQPKTVEALDALWRAYEKNTLSDIVDEVILTYEIMEEIGAMYLKMEVALDLKEYELCRKELMFEKVSRWKFERRRSASDMDTIVIPRDARYRWYYQEEEKTGLESARSLTDVYLMSAKRNAKLAQLTFEEELEMMKHPIPDPKYNVYDMIKKKLIDDNLRLQKELRELKETEKVLEEEGKDIDEEIVQIKANIKKQREDHRKREEKLKKEIAQLRREKAEYERLEAENKRLEKEIVVRIQEVHDMENSNEDSETQIKRLKEQLEAKTKELEEEFIAAASVQREPPMQGVRKFAEEGSEQNQYRGPSGIAINYNNEIVMADYNNHRLQIIGANYECRHVIEPSGFPKPMTPRDVAVSEDGRYFISDDSNKQIVVCMEDNSVVATFGQAEGLDPHGVALTKDNYLLVADPSKDCISKYSLEGKHVLDIGKSGNGRCQFRSPKSIAVTSKNFIVVSDCKNQRLQLLSADGIFITLLNGDSTKAGSAECCKEQMDPYGVAVDSRDQIYAVDYANNIVKVYGQEGSLIENLGWYQLIKPSFVALRYENPETPTMVVSEFERNNYKVFLL